MFRTTFRRRFAVSLWLLSVCGASQLGPGDGASSQAAEHLPASSRPKALNQHDVMPILLLRCAACHGRQVQEAGLDLRTRQAILKGGKSGPAMVPGKPNDSLIIQKIQAGDMPPRAKLASFSVKPVQDQELERLSQWIAMGAPEVDVRPDVATTQPDPFVSDKDRSFWSFQPPRPISIPDLDDGSRILNPIDAFILQRLQEQGLTLSPPADRLTRLRRAYFDLIGLPPPPEEVRAFAVDDDSLAYAKLIERLLASPRYGERWGQFWLDLAGYSDSEGVQHSDPIRPHAYRYRDYVIRSFNDDKPYDRFLLEQIAGDELADYENAAQITSELYDNLVATGFLRMSADGTFAGITGFVPNRLDVIDDQLGILSSSVMGLTLRCARCHSHKFDPIPQRDYYRMVALFKPAMDEHDWLKPVTGGAGNVAGEYRYLPQVTTAERKAWETHEKQLSSQIEQLMAELEQRQEDAAFKKEMEAKIKSLESQRRPEPMIRALWDRGQPSPTYLLQRGSYLRPRQLVGPGLPAGLTDGRTPFNARPPWPGSQKTGNRLALAKWLTQPQHPLTARVMVNRIWRHHFGRGIVETLDDFGRAGARPTHPKLLDWLAGEFVRSGWSIKHMHRLMMTSATYQQSSRVTQDHRERDAANRWLARMPMRRMEAEVLRDALLDLAGRLNLAQFGPADPVNLAGDGLVTSVARAGVWRRSIYVLKRRTQRLTILDNFDRPRMSPNCVERSESTVAPQALHLMNNRMVHELSLATAERLLATAPDDRQQQVRQLYLMAMGRPPLPSEEHAALEALDALAHKWKEHSAGDKQVAAAAAQRNALGNLCHAVMNSGAFLYVD